MSESSEARISSGLTSGSVLETGRVHPRLASGARSVPGSSSMNMSLSPVLGRSRRVRVGVDEVLVLGVEVQRDHGVAVLQADLRDVADAHARDAHRLALAGRDGLGGGERGLQLERLALPREAHALVVQDVAADQRRDEREPEDRGEVAGVLADRRLHACSSFTRGRHVGDLEVGALGLEVLAQPVDGLLQRLRLGGGRRAAARSKPCGAGVGHGAQVGRLLGLARHVGAQRRARVVLGRRRVDALQRLAGEEELVGRPSGRRTSASVSITRNHWPLASPERLSPARPGSGLVASS